MNFIFWVSFFISWIYKNFFFFFKENPKVMDLFSIFFLKSRIENQYYHLPCKSNQMRYSSFKFQIYHAFKIFRFILVPRKHQDAPAVQLWTTRWKNSSERKRNTNTRPFTLFMKTAVRLAHRLLKAPSHISYYEYEILPLGRCYRASKYIKKNNKRFRLSFLSASTTLLNKQQAPSSLM